MDNRSSFSALPRPAPPLGFGATIPSGTELPVDRFHDSFTIDGSIAIARLTALPRGQVVWLYFTGAPLVTAGSWLLCPGNANIQIAAGDALIMRSQGDGIWRVLDYLPAATAKLLAANNLSDVGSALTALGNLNGLSYGSAQTLSGGQKTQALANLGVGGWLGYYAGLQPLKLGNTIIGVNPGSFADSSGSAVYSTSSVLTCDLTSAKIGFPITGATIAAAGSSGTAGSQVVTVVGGTGVAAQLNVTIASGGITSVNSVANPGCYTTFPSNPAAVTGAGLSSATLNLAQGTIPVGGCLVGAMTASSGSGDYSDCQLYLVKRNSDGLLALVADVSNVYGGALAVTISNGSASFSTGGPPAGFWNGNPVRITSTGTIPSPFASGVDYYPVGMTNGQLSTALGLSGTRGGSAITATSGFSGALTLHYGVQDHLDAAHGAGVWTVLRGVHFAFRWLWQWPGSGGGIPDFTCDPRGDYCHFTYGGIMGGAPFQVLSNGTATSSTPFNCNTVLSNLCRVAKFEAVLTGTSAGTAYVMTPGSGLLEPLGEGPTAGMTTNYAHGVELQLDSQLNGDYEVTGGAKIVGLYIKGCWFVDPR